MKWRNRYRAWAARRPLAPMHRQPMNSTHQDHEYGLLHWLLLRIGIRALFLERRADKRAERDLEDGYAAAQRDDPQVPTLTTGKQPMDVWQRLRDLFR